MIAVDEDFCKEINDLKKTIEDHLGRRVSYPFVTNLMVNVFPKNIKVKEIMVNDQSKRKARTVQFVLEYLMEEI